MVIGILDNLVAKEREGYVVQLEVIQVMLPTHVQQQINSKPTTDRHIAKIKLARCQLGLLCLKLLIAPLIRLLAS